MAQVLEDVIHEVGAESVAQVIVYFIVFLYTRFKCRLMSSIQICTDNASNYALAGKLLEDKFKHLFWIPCVAHAMDLILEDIEKLPKFKNVICIAEDHHIHL